MSGEERRLARLAERHGPRVIAYITRRSDNADDAADVFQAVLEITWRRLDRVPSEEPAALAWMLAVARRCLANDRRGRRRRLEATERLAAELTLRGERSDGDELDRSKRTGELARALSTLSDDDRELVTFVYWDELPADTAAVVLGIRPAAARKRLQRARERLREQLLDETHTAPTLAPRVIAPPSASSP